MPTILYGLIEQRPNHPNFGCPFYIGIGTPYRPYRHFALARSAKKHTNQALQGVLEAHFALGMEPAVQILDRFQTQEEAFVAEITMIARYGRSAYEAAGTLCNLARGGQRTDPEAQRLSWLDEGIRAKRIAAMKGVKKTDTPAGRAARQANGRLPRSEEGLAAQKAASDRNWADPAFVAERSRVQTEAWESPEKRASMLAGRSEGIAKSWDDADTRAKRTDAVSAAIKDKWTNDSEYAERARKALKESWADPVKKAERVAKMLATRAAKASQRAPTVSAARSANMTAINKRMSVQDRSDIQAHSWADPEIAAARKAGIKQAAQDPALKAARLAAMAEGKRRAARARAEAAEVQSGESEVHVSAD